ncbi:hypothetical protein [Desulforamulus putei]|uniref:hypothetical protein n=1 Tax=Desulforamulus putei TaxID=74701 RepID=UPI002FDDD31D
MRQGTVFSCRILNHSILAHGTEPVGKDLYVKFAPTVTGICGIDDKEIPVFPSLDI